MIPKKKLHICFNLIADPNWHAGNIYIFNCIHALSLLNPEERKQLYISIACKDKKDIPADVSRQVDRIFQDTILHLAFYKLLKLLPSILRLSLFNFRKIDFYYPAGNLPKNWIFPWGGWIPDFQYRYLPHLFSQEEYDQREKRNSYLASQAQILALSSENALKDYVQFFPNHKQNAFLLRFVSNAQKYWYEFDPIVIQQKFNLPDRFFIVCNQFWKHKDHSTIIEAIASLKQRGILITVVCTGATEDFRNPTYFTSLMKKAEEKDIVSQFIVLGFISRHDQLQLIRRSLAIIQPSLFEGWSTVVEDGRALGKTIFLSDFAVHLEQNPPYAIYFGQQNSEQLALLIETHLNQLLPGPDNEKERKAFEENQIMMREFGQMIVRMTKQLAK